MLKQLTEQGKKRLFTIGSLISGTILLGLVIFVYSYNLSRKRDDDSEETAPSSNIKVSLSESPDFESFQKLSGLST